MLDLSRKTKLEYEKDPVIIKYLDEKEKLVSVLRKAYILWFLLFKYINYYYTIYYYTSIHISY